MSKPATRVGHWFWRALAVWLVLITVEFVHGILRAIFLVPVVGDFAARQFGVATGSVLILLVAYLFVDWLNAPNTKSLFGIGLMWLVLTLAFEFGFGHFVFGRSWANLAEDYDLRQGGMLLLGMIVLGLSPWIGAEMRHRIHDGSR